MRAFRILVNRSATWAEFDEELLSLELQELAGADIDLSLTGLDPRELEDLLTLPDQDEQADIAPPLPENPVSRPGDLWLAGKRRNQHRVLCNLGVEFGRPRSPSSNQREHTARKKPRNVADTGEGKVGDAVQKTGPWGWGEKVVAPLCRQLSNFSVQFLCRARRAIRCVCSAWRLSHGSMTASFVVRYPDWQSFSAPPSRDMPDRR